jgi:DNA-directed RNA polymerase subunit M/transcription elongation factor TFIIS
MFYCPNCNNIYNITKNPSLNIIQQTSDSISITTSENKEEIKNIAPIDNKNSVYFICNNCGNSEKIPNNTIIIKKTKEKNTKSDLIIDAEDILNAPYLPITRNYVCPNKNCESHKEKSKREATFIRLPDSFTIQYVCNACQISWK